MYMHVHNQLSMLVVSPLHVYSVLPSLTVGDIISTIGLKFKLNSKWKY